MRIRTIVTGATSGIGYELAVQLAAVGRHVIALGRQRQQPVGTAMTRGRCRTCSAGRAGCSHI